MYRKGLSEKIGEIVVATPPYDLEVTLRNAVLDLVVAHVN